MLLVDTDKEVNEPVADNETKKGKKGKRKAGDPPQSARQQNDSQVLEKLGGIAGPLGKVWQMSVPRAKTDNPFGLTLGEQKEQEAFPDVLHGAYCYTQMKPNVDGSSKTLFLEKPVLRVCVPSQYFANKLPDILEDIHYGRCELETVSGVFEYLESFVDQNVKAKPKSQPREGSKRQMKKAKLREKVKVGAIDKSAKKRRIIESDEEE